MADSTLEKTIDKILGQTEKDIINNLGAALADSKKNLDDFVPKLEREYDKIISDGRKEADKVEKQIIGSSDLESRNKQLLLVEDSVERVFANALEQISKAERNDNYSNLIKNLLSEATSILGTTQVKVFTNAKDKDVVQSVISQFAGAELSSDKIDCLGGIKVKSKDGAMTFDNTLDARIQRMKPLIRKEIAVKFGVGN